MKLRVLALTVFVTTTIGLNAQAVDPDDSWSEMQQYDHKRMLEISHRAGYSSQDAMEADARYSVGEHTRKLAKDKEHLERLQKIQKTQKTIQTQKTQKKAPNDDKSQVEEFVDDQERFD